MKKLFVSLAAAALFSTSAMAEEPHVAPIQELVKTQVQAWLNSPDVIKAVKAQNEKHAGLSDADIDSLDKKWRAETKASSKPMIDEVLSNALSKYLKKVEADAQGLYTEIFVMDNKGLNVGQSAVTSDYWQGDEAKFKKSYGAGAGAVFIDEIEQDESTQQFQSQVSVAISDGGQVIGAVTIGVNVDQLLN
jgi:hypothetical protein